MYIGDLSIIKEFFDSPLQFIHYLRLRLEAEYKSYVAFTELAFLGAYEDNFLTNIDHQSDTTAITHVLFQFEEHIMRELAKKRERKGNFALRRDIPTLFQNTLKTLETLRPYGFTDVGIGLLEVASASLQEFAARIETARKTLAVEEKDLHSVVLVDLRSGIGISYIIAGDKVEPDEMKAALFLDCESSNYRGQLAKWISIVERKGDRLPLSMAAAIELKSH